MTIESLIRSVGVRRGRSYYPFTEPPYRGGYPFKAPRVTSVNTNGLGFLAVAASTIPALRALTPRSTNYLYEDRRLWAPVGEDWPKSKTSANPRVVDLGVSPKAMEIDPDVWRRIHKPLTKIDWSKMAKESWKLAPATTKWTWENPYKMIICLKRKMRREVMHALGIAGRSGFKKPRFTQYSFVRCY